MHFEILVEDQSGKKMIETLLPKIIDRNRHTVRVIAYKGIGHIPKDMSAGGDAGKRILLQNLPRLLRGYGKTFPDYPEDCPAAIILICDLDNKCLKAFRKELDAILASCNPKPETRFCIAIEEGEAWLLGDIPAIKTAYPKAKEAVLNHYENDSICGTWERLADAVFPGGSSALLGKGPLAIGAEKSKWAEKITPHMSETDNKSPSFAYFRSKILELADIKTKTRGGLQ